MIMTRKEEFILQPISGGSKKITNYPSSLVLKQSILLRLLQARALCYIYTDPTAVHIPMDIVWVAVSVLCDVQEYQC